MLIGFPGCTSGKEPTCQCRRHKRQELDPSWVGKVPWRRAWQVTLVAQRVKEKSPCNTGDPGFGSLVGRILWRREWLPIPVYLPGELYGERSLAGYSPWGQKESDTTERLPKHIYFITCFVFILPFPLDSIKAPWGLRLSFLFNVISVGFRIFHCTLPMYNVQ